MIKPFINRTRSRRSRKNRGAATVEFAVCLPVIVILVLGSIEATTMIFLKQSLTVAAYEGARTAIVPDATSADVQQICEEILADRRVNNASVSIIPNNLDALEPGDFIRIEVDAPCDGNSILSGRIFQGRDMQGAAEFMKEF